MKQLVVVSGKGGTGKTTVAALTVSRLIAAGSKPVLAVDAEHPFPFISNLGLNLAVILPEAKGKGEGERFVRVKVPDNRPYITSAACCLENVPLEQVIAANLDRVFVVTTVGQDYNPRRLERYLTVVWNSGAEPVIVINKADLPHQPNQLHQDLERVALELGGGTGFDPKVPAALQHLLNRNAEGAREHSNRRAFLHLHWSEVDLVVLAGP